MLRRITGTHKGEHESDATRASVRCNEICMGYRAVFVRRRKRENWFDYKGGCPSLLIRSSMQSRTIY